MKRSKVIVLGFHKTGTSALAKALDILGYNVEGPNAKIFAEYMDGNFDYVKKHTEKFDAFQDDPWFLLYREMDAWYPDAKFILTLRESQNWYDSVVNHFEDRLTETRSFMYGGVPAPDGEQLYKETYNRHVAEVRGHFRGRGNFIEIDLAKNSDWSTICDFLGEDVPKDALGREAKSIPRVNSKRSRQIHDKYPSINKARHVAKCAVYSVFGSRLGGRIRSLYSALVYGAGRS